jgi:hypothetical protein
MHFFSSSLAVLLLATTVALEAQQPPQPNTVSATVSVLQPMTAGTATFQIQFLDANSNSTLDSALSAAGGAGAAASTLSGISVSLNQGFVVTQYDFTVPVPAAQYAATRDKLIAAQRVLANSNSQGLGWSTSYAATEEDAAKALELAMPNLLTQARQQAAVLATAMSSKTGNIVAISTPALVNSGLSLSVSATVTFSVSPQ